MLRPLSALLVFTVALPAAAYELRKDASGTVVRWHDHVQFVIDAKLGKKLNEPGAEAAVRAAVETMAAASRALAVSVKVGAAQGMGYDVNHPTANQNEITVLEDWPYQEDALAVTIVTVNGATHEVLDADIAFNAEEHAFAVLAGTGGPARDDERLDDIQNTLTHELGHALGLMHNPADPLVVMYPSSAPGEITKRTLAADDVAGLVTLYSVAAAPPAGDLVPQQGCSAAAGGSMPWALLVSGLGLLRLRRRALVAALAVAPAVALAQHPKQHTPDLIAAPSVAVGEVVAATPVSSEQNPRLLFTDLTVTTRQCLKGACNGVQVIRVPGGRLGDLEQSVVDHPVPRLGTHLAVFPVRGKLRLYRLETAEDWSRLSEAASRAALPLPVSPAPQAGQSNPHPLTQPPGSTR